MNYLGVLCSVYQCVISEHEEVSYLAIAGGIFGRLSMGFTVPLAEVIELISIAQQLAPAVGTCDKPSLV